MHNKYYIEYVYIYVFYIQIWISIDIYEDVKGRKACFTCLEGDLGTVGESRGGGLGHEAAAGAAGTAQGADALEHTAFAGGSCGAARGAIGRWEAIYIYL